MARGPRYEMFYEDHAYRQKQDLLPDDLSAQDPDWIFLGELIQISEGQRNEPIQSVLYRVGGPVRNTANVEINETIFSRPEQTQFVLVECEDGMRYFERFDPERHGEWEQIQDTGMTPTRVLPISTHMVNSILPLFINLSMKENNAAAPQKPIGAQATTPR